MRTSRLALISALPLAVFALGLIPLALLAGCAPRGEVSFRPAPDTRPVAVELVSVGDLAGVGAAQGLTVREGRLLIYGDAQTGVAQALELVSGDRVRAVGPPLAMTQVTAEGTVEDLLPHPTGMTVAPGQPTLIGSTVNRVGTIRAVRWDAGEPMPATLDGRVLHTVLDDAAVNGTRPEYVRFGGRWLVATSDYGPQGNQVRLYDPEKLLKAQRTSEPGVLVAAFPCGPFVQSLCWVDSAGLLTLVQNTTPGLGWRLTFLDLQASLDQGQAVVVATFDLPPTDELEGFALLPGGEVAVMCSAMSRDNVRVARVTWGKR